MEQKMEDSSNTSVTRGLNKLADLREAELRAEFNRELRLLPGVEGRDGKDRLA